MNRKTAHSYPKVFKSDYGQIKDVIVVEATWLGYYEPHTTKPIVSFVGNMMINNEQADMAGEYNLLPFDVRVLEPSRTLCEKIMSLVRFSYSENPINELKKKVRHTYDMHQLLKQKEFDEFLQSDDFETMLIKVANDDVSSFKNNNEWLIHHPNESLMFKNVDKAWENLKESFNNDFSGMVYGDLPDDNDILMSLKKIQDRMALIKWTIELESQT